jgi:hypothetical protein
MIIYNFACLMKFNAWYINTQPHPQAFSMQLTYINLFMFALSVCIIHKIKWELRHVILSFWSLQINNPLSAFPVGFLEPINSDCPACSTACTNECMV